MPLSEHEQRLLEQMERALYAEDPKLASTLRGTRPTVASRRHLVLAVLAGVAGMGLLLAGVAIPLWPLGVAGFLVMLAGVYLGMRSYRRAGAATASGAAPSSGRQRSSKPKPRKAGLMSRFEQRWDRRQEGRGE